MSYLLLNRPSKTSSTQYNSPSSTSPYEPLEERWNQACVQFDSSARPRLQRRTVYPPAKCRTIDDSFISRRVRVGVCTRNDIFTIFVQVTNGNLLQFHQYWLESRIDFTGRWSTQHSHVASIVYILVLARSVTASHLLIHKSKGTCYSLPSAGCELADASLPQVSVETGSWKSLEKLQHIGKCAVD